LKPGAGLKSVGAKIPRHENLIFIKTIAPMIQGTFESSLGFEG
jgi:hypothetical protein